MTLDHVTTQAQKVRQLERASKIERARAELHARIRSAHAAGHTMRAIAEAAGISHQRVAQIIARQG